MDYSIKTFSPIKLIGIEIMTSYKNSMQDIPMHWEKFNQENIADNILNKLSKDVYAVYHNYESDFKGSYDFFIGCSVEEKNNVDNSFKVLEIPAQKYAVFSVVGDFPKSLIDTWEAIWEADIQRKYTFDFEKYKENSIEDVPDLDVYIAIE
jgi:predicted transcriptional regulator YdeE